MYRCYCVMWLLMIVYVYVLMQTPVMNGVASVGTDTRNFNRSTDTKWLCCDRERETHRSVTRYVQTRTITITQLIKHHKIWDGDGVEASTRHNMYHDEQLAFRVGCLLCVCSFLTQAWSMYTTSCRCIVSPSYISMLPGLTRKTSMCSLNTWDFPNDMTGTWSLSCRA